MEQGTLPEIVPKRRRLVINSWVCNIRTVVVVVVTILLYWGVELRHITEMQEIVIIWESMKLAVIWILWVVTLWRKILTIFEDMRNMDRPALPREIRAWRRLRIVKRDETSSLIFFSVRRNIWSWSWVRRSCREPTRQGACPGGDSAPPPSWTGRGPPGLDSFASMFYIFQRLSPWIFKSFRELLFSEQ